MRKIIFAILLALVSSTYSQTLAPADIKELLDRIRQARTASPHVQADFQEERIVHLMNKPIASSGKVWFEPPNKFRREVRGNSPSLSVSDGKELWIYYPNFKSAEHYQLGKHSPADAAITAINTALNLENVEATFQITGTKQGNDYELQLLPRSPSMKRMFQRFVLRINPELLVDRTEMFQPNGDRIVTTYSNQSKALIPPSMFEFSAPPGTEISNPLGK